MENAFSKLTNRKNLQLIYISLTNSIEFKTFLLPLFNIIKSSKSQTKNLNHFDPDPDPLMLNKTTNNTSGVPVVIRNDKFGSIYYLLFNINLLLGGRKYNNQNY